MPSRDYQALYFELILAVGMKHPNESRHQTALRYIRQAEESSGPAMHVASTTNVAQGDVRVDPVVTSEPPAE